MDQEIDPSVKQPTEPKLYDDETLEKFDALAQSTFDKIAAHPDVFVIGKNHVRGSDVPCSIISIYRTKNGTSSHVGGTIQISKLPSGTVLICVVELNMTFTMPEPFIERLENAELRDEILQKLTTALAGGGIFEYLEATKSVIVKTSYVLPDACDDILDVIGLKVIDGDFVDYLAETMLNELTQCGLVEKPVDGLIDG